MAPSTRLNRDALDRILEQQLGLITRRQSLAVGLTGHALQHRLRVGGPWQYLLPGVYLTATGSPRYIQKEMAALLYAGPESVITGPAALSCHHIRVEPSDLVDVLVPVRRQRRDVALTR
jgi:hypothetical protein